MQSKIKINGWNKARPIIFVVFLIICAYTGICLMISFNPPKSIEKAHQTFGESLNFLPCDTIPEAIMMVAHGLNVKPAAMNALSDVYKSMRMNVFALQLEGHRQNSNMEDVTLNKWLNEAEYVYSLAKQQADSLNIPIYFTGYSLGALVGESIVFNSKGSITFDKQVLIAPATAIRSRSRLIKLLFPIGNSFLIKSVSPKAYRAKNGTSVGAYKVLFFLEETLIRGRFSSLNIPTLIIIDQKDELINAQILKARVVDFTLDKYQFIFLDSEEVASNSSYHHLVIDKNTMGPNNWSMTLQQLAQFFK